jgi:hypothetical protein
MSFGVGLIAFVQLSAHCQDEKQRSHNGLIGGPE